MMSACGICWNLEASSSILIAVTDGSFKITWFIVVTKSLSRNDNRRRCGWLSMFALWIRAVSSSTCFVYLPLLTSFATAALSKAFSDGSTDDFVASSRVFFGGGAFVITGFSLDFLTAGEDFVVVVPEETVDFFFRWVGVLALLLPMLLFLVVGVEVLRSDGVDAAAAATDPVLVSFFDLLMEDEGLPPPPTCCPSNTLPTDANLSLKDPEDDFGIDGGGGDVFFTGVLVGFHLVATLLLVVLVVVPTFDFPKGDDPMLFSFPGPVLLTPLLPAHDGFEEDAEDEEVPPPTPPFKKGLLAIFDDDFEFDGRCMILIQASKMDRIV